jgi:hypothetical protein
MDIYAEIAQRIIKQQESIIGPVAVEQAEGIPNLKINWPKHQVSITGDGAHTVDALVEKYKKLFGQLSVEVCRDAASPLISKVPSGQLPKSLA